MLRYLKKKKTEVSDGEALEPKGQYHQSMSADKLLEKPEYQTLILKIKRLFSLSEDVWEQHYLYSIKRFAEIVQLCPASEIHHHSNDGGLLLHTLETLHNGVRISLGYILPPNADPEDISVKSDKWRFGIFITILSHDIGKIVTDIEVVHRSKGGDFIKWHPWHGSMPIGNEYAYRYRDKVKNPKVSKSLHEKASMSLLPQLLTKEAATWIFDDLELLGQMFNTISHSTIGGQTVAEIVRKADGASVASNLGAQTGLSTQHSTSIPLHEKVIVALRELITGGHLKRNRPGAAIWVTEKQTWVVSKTSMEAVQLQLKNEGHTGIPKNPVRLFEVLREHQLAIPNQQGDSVWHGLVEYYPTSWKQKLTFLRFPNEVIWPTSNPESFDGKIVPMTREGKVIEEGEEGEEGEETETRTEKLLEGEGDNISNTENRKIINLIPDYQVQVLAPTPMCPVVETKDVPKAAALQNSSPEVESVAVNNVKKNENPQSGSADSQMTKPLFISKDKKMLVADSHFLTWVETNVLSRVLKCNEKKAPVHILEDYIVLISPRIFQIYLAKNPSIKRLYEHRDSHGKTFTLIQKDLEKLGINKKSLGGRNIITLVLTGEKKTADITGYLLDRRYFPKLAGINANRALSIKD